MTKMNVFSAGVAVYLLLGLSAPSIGRSTENEAIKVSIELPKRVYSIGERLDFVIRATQDCYFIVFTIDAGGQVELHDPTSTPDYMGSSLLRAGESRRIPVSGAPGHAIITPPAGEYEIGAVCGREELSAYGLDIRSMIAPAKSGRRGFKFFLDNAFNTGDVRPLAQITTRLVIRD